MPSSIHFWDMDHTLIDNDCDVSWKVFLVDHGIAPRNALAKADRFFELYRQARLPHDEFMAFQLAEFTGRTPEDMRELCRRHFEEVVRQRIFPGALATVQRQLADGKRLCLLTATNRYIAEPVAAHFGFPDVLATELELRDGRFTGALDGIYCGGIAKLEVADRFCRQHGATLADAYYYGDSKADIPALEGIGHPVAVNPAPALREQAERQGWPILDWE